MMKSVRILILFSGVLALFSCTREASRVTVVLDWTVNTNHTGLYAALEKGYFRNAGLDVAVESPPESGAVGILAAGKADFAFSYQEEVSYARAAGIPIVAVAAVIQHNTSGFASRKGAGITSPGDFEGKRYGGWGSPMEEAVISALMEKYGKDYETLSNIAVGSMDFFVATERDVDFTWIFEGWDGVAARVRGVEIDYIPLREEDPALDYYTPVVVTAESLAASEPDRIKKFLEALSAGYRFAAEDPDAAAEILLRQAPELDRAIVVESQRYLAGKYIDDALRWGEMDAARWERFARWMIDRGLLDGGFDPGAAFTNEFLPK